MPRKPKAKRPGRPALAKGTGREMRAIRLPPALWRRIEAFGPVTATIERGVTELLDRHADNQTSNGNKS